MTNTKQPRQSKTLVGAIVALLMFVLQTLEVDLDEGAVTELVILVLELAGICFAIYGRVTAKKNISI